ncbi:MAG: hypothetical protein ABSH53_05005 [Holophaga sp.]
MVRDVRFMRGGAFGVLAVLTVTVRAQVVVVPRRVTLRPGQVQAFRALWAVPRADGSAPDCRWRLAPEGSGDLDERTGAYTAPAVEDTRTVRIEAVPADGSSPPGKAEVTLLPHDPFHLLDQVLGEGWLEPFSADLPFQDLETGRRFPAPGRVVAGDAHRFTRLFPCAHGLPCRLRWTVPPGATAQLLSYREGGEVVRRDATGRRPRRSFPGPRCGTAWWRPWCPPGPARCRSGRATSRPCRWMCGGCSRSPATPWRTGTTTAGTGTGPAPRRGSGSPSGWRRSWGGTVPERPPGACW